MKKYAGVVLLVCVIAVRAYAVDDHLPQPRKTAEEHSQTIPKKDDSDVPSFVAAPDGKPRTVSREGAEYLERLKKGTPFGTADFNLDALRAGMGARNEPRIEGVKLIRLKIGDVPCEWVLAPGADPDLRLLYLHGGGWVSGSGGNYLPLAADISVATDFTLTSESLKTVHDPIISARTMPEFRDRYLEKMDPRNPLASPVFGDYRGIPPLLIQVGEHEMLRDDSVRVAKKALADGIPVKLEVWPGMVHVFQIRGLPESREAIQHIADFMRSRLPKSR